ncbi:MAG: phosphatase PAP2 family protein [Solirubrobacteraceae bacterium]
MIALVLGGWGAGELSRSALQGADLEVVRDIAARRTVLLTGVGHVLSLAGSVFLLGPLAVVCCAALYRRGRPRSAILIALSSGGAALMFNVEKLIVARPRPPVDHLVAAAHSSFPSGHATVSAALYLSLVIVFLARGPHSAAALAPVMATVLLVAGIALSRVYLGVHYPTDVAGGALFGATWTLLVASLLRAPERQPPATGNQSTPASAIRASEPHTRGRAPLAGA